ncbi:MAG: polysaccharide pyruvyl transferase family protein [Bacteroidales bacterium]|jgi:polysaccharide pyruvyl transferase WcaK-like protein|nr:polysaccharide pyruvyl transferase family protein [Bacteroidales bacterium]
MIRREFSRYIILSALGLTMTGGLSCRTGKKTGTILIVSGWQDINIGDIAHTPGLLNVLQTFLPDAELILWKKSRGGEVELWLSSNFPGVKIVHGEVDTDFNVSSREVIDAFSRSDIMIHGSGPSVVGSANLEAWVKATGKPFGIFGTTIQNIDEKLKSLLQKASFIFTRETASLEVLRNNGIDTANMMFVPDATFFMQLTDKGRADIFLKEKGLVHGKYICVIPRLRRTPYYLIRPESYTEDQVKSIDELNNSKKEEDHSKLREVIIAWVRETGNRVLVCPEMTYQIDIMDELLINPLPDDVKPYVTKRSYWLPDEAASVYSHAFAVLSFECHSPILSLVNGTPAFYLRQPEDTIKGQMYYDLGLSDWVFEIEQVSGSDIAGRLKQVISDYDTAKKKVEKLGESIKDIYRNSAEVILNTRA